jgi:hypothetical protein
MNSCLVEPFLTKFTWTLWNVPWRSPYSSTMFLMEHFWSMKFYGKIENTSMLGGMLIKLMLHSQMRLKKLVAWQTSKGGSRTSLQKPTQSSTCGSSTPFESLWIHGLQSSTCGSSTPFESLWIHGLRRLLMFFSQMIFSSSFKLYLFHMNKHIFN